MNAIYLDREAQADALILGDIPTPHPADGEALIRVHAAAVTPTELQWYPTFHTKTGGLRPFPVVLGHEFSGVVAALGPNIESLQIGDAVFGLNDWFVNGAQAEYCIAPVASLAPKPKTLDHTQAASVPISALTAWQGLFQRAQLQPGQTVLIHGAAGGVGVFAVQLARWRGASVLATASSGNLAFVRDLGAGVVIDYRATRFEEVARHVDVVFDAVGGETLERSWATLKPGGRLVTVATQSEGVSDPRIRDAFMLVESKGAQLAEISNLIDTGALKVFVEDTYPLARARDAFQRAQQGRMRGKLVLRIAEPSPARKSL